MKKTVFIIFSLLFSTISIHAQTWEFVGLDSMVIKHLYVSGDTIWAGTAHRVGNLDKSGIYRPIDGGKTWVQLDSVLGIGNIGGFYIDEEHTNNIFIIKGFNAYSSAGPLYKTTNGGESWEVAQNATQNVIQWFGISPFNNNEIYFIDAGWIPGGIINNLYRSTESGVTWAELGPFPGSSHGSKLTFAYDLIDSMSLYVTVDTQFDQYLYKSTDKGNNWFFVSTPPVTPAETRTDLFLPGRIYLFAQYKATDNGGFNWYNFDSGLNNQRDYLSFYMNENYPNKLFNLRRDGLYVTKNDSINWQLIEDSETLPLNIGSGGFNFDDVGQMTNLFINPDNDIIYIGTAQGLYKSSVLTNVTDKIENIINNLSLRQNYPNPFNSSTVIEYQIISRANVSLKIYDILGNELATLVDEEQPAGNYKVTFDIGIIRGYNFTSGVYIYQIQAGGYVSSRKMIYLK